MTHTLLTRYLIQAGVIRSPLVISAFDAVGRRGFLPENCPYDPDVNEPIPIGFDATNSQPATVGLMLEWLQAERGHRVLDIGCGSGWTTALLAHIVGPMGTVTGVDIVPELVEFARHTLTPYAFSNVHLYCAKKGVIGMPGHVFDRILVSASAFEFPEPLFDQLSSTGRIVAPVATAIHVYQRYPNGQLSVDRYPGFQFVPLQG